VPFREEDFMNWWTFLLAFASLGRYFYTPKWSVAHFGDVRKNFRDDRIAVGQKLFREKAGN